MTTIPPPSFEHLMQRYHGEIARNLDAATLACPNGLRANQKACSGCDFFHVGGRFSTSLVCDLSTLISVIGPVPREPLTGPEPSPPPCPKCGSPTFRANIDDQDMILCYNDACKWKGPAEIGRCIFGRSVMNGILCTLSASESCPHQEWEKKYNLWWCKREDAALAACEQYQQEIKQRDGS